MIETIPTMADLDQMGWKELKELARESGVPVARRPRKLITVELAQVLKSPPEPEPVDLNVVDNSEMWLHYPPGVQRGKGHWMASVASHVPTTIFVYNPAGALACSFFAHNQGIKMDHRKHAKLFVDLMEG